MSNDAPEALRPSGWQPIEKAPTAGCFLVYMPDEHRKYQVMYRSEKNRLSIIGGVFAFDLSKPTLWMPIEEVRTDE